MEVCMNMFDFIHRCLL